jgi:glycosyltransferase involved in cell wall biosynthesis
VLKAKGKISVVIPVYNSATSLHILIAGLVTVLEQMEREFEIILVDDCSTDNSWEVLKKMKEEHGKLLKIAKLSTNSGQHNAIICGFSLVSGDIVITMDDDLQNPPEEIPKLVAAIDRGYDLAIGAYGSKKHSSIRNAGGGLIDWLQRRIFNLPQGFQLTSFRAINRTVVNNVCKMGDVFPYLTSMLFTHTSRYISIDVRHEPRRFGTSNYNIKRSLNLAANLIMNYSSYPLYFVAMLCLFAFLFLIFYASVVLYQIIANGISIPGWASTIVIISFFNALILLCMLILCLYISRMNQQITHRRLSYSIGELYE